MTELDEGIEDDKATLDEIEDDDAGMANRLASECSKEPLWSTYKPVRSGQLALKTPAQLPKINHIRSRSASYKSKTENTDTVQLMRSLIPWTTQFAPRKIADLAIHKRKILELRSWLELYQSGCTRHRVLLIQGPSGCGKSTTLELIAADLGLEVRFWSPILTSRFEQQPYYPLSSKFNEFFDRSSKFSCLQLKRLDTETRGVSTNSDDLKDPKSWVRPRTSRIIVVEDSQFTPSNNSPFQMSFRARVGDLLAKAIQPACSDERHDSSCGLILLMSHGSQGSASDLEDTLTAHKLLGSDLMSHPMLSTIDFNPIAPTLMKKALERIRSLAISTKEVSYPNHISSLVLDDIAQTGDIRSATNALEFLSCHTTPLSSGVTTKITPAIPSIQRSFLSPVSTREVSTQIFHAIGKVLYNKRDEKIQSRNISRNGSDHLLDASSPTRRMDSSMIVRDMSTDLDTISMLLHENFVESCLGDNFSGCLSACLDNLSDLDTLRTRKRPKLHASDQKATTTDLVPYEIACEVLITGFWASLPNPVTRTGPTKSGRARMCFVRSGFFQHKKEMQIRRDKIRALRHTSFAETVHAGPVDARYQDSYYQKKISAELWRVMDVPDETIAKQILPFIGKWLPSLDIKAASRLSSEILHSNLIPHRSEARLNRPQGLKDSDRSTHEFQAHRESGIRVQEYTPDLELHEDRIELDPIH